MSFIAISLTRKDIDCAFFLSDEEITSSGEEQEQEQSSTAAATEAGFQGVKHKMKVEEYEEVLSKRHAVVLPFRDQTINK